jgi:arginine exporter protein ArgO
MHRRSFLVLVILLATLGVSAATAEAKVKLPSIISDNMVLQQGRPVTIWGWAIYGARGFHAAFFSNASLVADASSGTPLATAVLACLAFTWLNPHVYLDTFVLLGSVSTQFPDEKVQFALGATSASFLFFFTLGYGARLLAPLFKRPGAWKALEFLIGVVMWSIAFSLIRADLFSHD